MNWLDFEVKGQGHDETIYGQKGSSFSALTLLVGLFDP